MNASGWLPPELRYAVEPENVQYILDAGGNVGFSAIFFASIFPDATILTIEADPNEYVENCWKWPTLVVLTPTFMITSE